MINTVDLPYLITIITPVIALTIFWYKISTSQKEISSMTTKILERQTKTNEKTDLFYQKIANDIEGFKSENTRQQALCANHNGSLTMILQNQKAHELAQSYMKELFEDIKKLQVTTNEAITNNTGVLTELLFIIKERK